MPCDSSYLDANSGEIALSRVFQLLDEVAGKRKKPTCEGWDGYDNRAYGRYSRELLDAKVAELCAALKPLPKARIAKFSLEMQLWWRDHQRADRRRTR